MSAVTITAQRFSQHFGMPVHEYEVLLDGVKYRCDDLQLDQLYDGIDPKDLDLILVEDGDD